VESGETITNSIGMKLVLIPPREVAMGSAKSDRPVPQGKIALIQPAEFLMGSADSDAAGWHNEKPQHRVTITKPFYLGTTEVTQEQYEQIMGENPSHYGGDPQRPVESVSWDDAQEFCRRLSEKEGETYRLPTEAQWEYACRAGSTTKWYFGDDESQLADYAWYKVNSYLMPHSVARKKPNAWGLYDMHGNVWEWCDDWFETFYYGNSPNTDPTGPASGETRVYRGGCWNHEATYCRSAFRGNSWTGERALHLGFRVSLVPAE